MISCRENFSSTQGNFSSMTREDLEGSRTSLFLSIVTEDKSVENAACVGKE